LALNGRSGHRSRLRYADSASLGALGRRVAAAMLARGAARPTALSLARAADAAACRGVALSAVADELHLDVTALVGGD
jgi:hypothetical protein